MSEPILQRFCRAFGNNVFRGISRVMKSRSIYTNVTETNWAEVIRGTGSSTQIAGQKETPSIRLSPEAAWAQHSTNFLRLAKPPQTSYSGRSVPVINGDVARANRALNTILSNNSTARDWFQSDRYKKPGDLRRQRRSSRWRKRFKHELTKKVALVKEIRRRGS